MEIGKCYMIYTVTFYFIGKCVEYRPGLCKLTEASMVSGGTGPMSSIAKGKVEQSERLPGEGDCWVNLAATAVAWMPWDHPLPTAK